MSGTTARPFGRTRTTTGSVVSAGAVKKVDDEISSIV